jgi:tetratricopeptide (TPR) repeat protein
MSALVADLADERRRLAALSLPTEDTAVRSVFATSYHALSGAARRLFRLLGLLPEPEASGATCAALVEAPAAALEELRAGHLVQRTPAGRYQLHDLTHLYARELVEREEPTESRIAAERRLVDWYVAIADRADLVVRPFRGWLFDGTPVEGNLPEFADATAALTWFDVEAASLLGIVERAEHTYPEGCWRLVAVMYGWLERHQRRTAWIPVCEAGARAAEAAGDREGVALLRNTLAIFHCHLERFDQAAEAFRQVVAVRREIGPPRGLAATLMNLGNVYVETGRDKEAMPCLVEALELFERQPDGQAMLGPMYDNLGWAHRSARRFDEAIECHTRASGISREFGDHQSVASAEGNLATVHADCGRHEVAVAHWQTSVEHARDAGDLRLVADGLAGLGRARLRLGDGTAARADLTEALALYGRIGSDRRAEVAALLAALPA